MLRRKDIQRTLIENTLRLHLKRYDSDSERTLRRLIDIGLSVSKTPRQSMIFKRIALLFKDEKSTYYPALKKEFDNVNRDHFIHFCTNLGYLSWKKGAGVLNSYIKETRDSESWLKTFLISDNNKEKLNTSSLSNEIQVLNKKGIYAFNFNIHFNNDVEAILNILIPVINTYQDSNFLICLPDVIIDDNTIEQLSLLPNILVAIPYNKESTFAMSELLFEEKIFYGLYYYYGKDEASDYGYELLEDTFENMSQENTSAIFMIPSEGLTDKEKKAVNKKILRYRSGRYFPLLITDFLYDVDRINDYIINK